MKNITNKNEKKERSSLVELEITKENLSRI
jgi:hypothetical protein